MKDNRTLNYGVDAPAARCVQGVFSYLLTLITLGSVQWGYAIGSKP